LIRIVVLGFLRLDGAAVDAFRNLPLQLELQAPNPGAELALDEDLALSRDRAETLLCVAADRVELREFGRDRCIDLRLDLRCQAVRQLFGGEIRSSWTRPKSQVYEIHALAALGDRFAQLDPGARLSAVELRLTTGAATDDRVVAVDYRFVDGDCEISAGVSDRCRAQVFGGLGARKCRHPSCDKGEGEK
jgi:hypothetical protein